MGFDILTAAASVLGFVGASSVISGMILRRIDKLERSLDSRERDRIEENVTRGELLHSTGKLTEANTVALRAITSEGVCECELREYRTAAEKLEHFMRTKSAAYIHSN